MKFYRYVFFAALGFAMAGVQGTVFGEDGKAQEVVATVGSEKITRGEIDQFTKNLPDPFRKAFESKALEQLIDSKVFYNAAVKEGLDKTPEFEARLNKERERILAAYYLEKLSTARLAVSPSEVKAYYDKNKSRYILKTRVRVAQILVKSPKDAEEMKRLLAKGEPFEKLANEHSIVPGAKDGGDMGWLERGKMPNVLEDKAFAMKKGDVSDVIKTPMGYHIIKILDRKEGGEKSFEEVKPQIEKTLAAMKMKDIKEEYRQKADVRIVSEEYKKAFPLK